MNIPAGALVYTTAVPSSQLFVANQLVAYRVEVYNGATHASAGALMTPEVAKVDINQSVTLYFVATGTGIVPYGAWPAPLTFYLTPGTQVLPVYYTGLLAAVQAAEVQLQCVDLTWTCTIVPCNFSDLGFARNSFGTAPVLAPGTALLPNIAFSMATAAGAGIAFSGGAFQAGASATFSFGTFPDIGGRCMLYNNSGDVLAVGAGGVITAMSPAAWQASSPAFQQWGFLLASPGVGSASPQAVLICQDTDGVVRALVDGTVLSPLATVLRTDAPPGMATSTSSASPYIILTTAGGVAAALPPAGPAGTITLTSQLVGGAVAVAPVANILAPSASLAFAGVGFPFTCTLTVTLPQAELSVDPILITVTAESAVVDVPYAVVSGYEYKTYAQVVTAYDPSTQTATVSLRPFAPGTNGFVENSFGTPRAGYASGRQGFFFNTPIALVPYAAFAMYNSAAGGWLEAVGGSAGSVATEYTFVTIAATKRQQLLEVANQVPLAPRAMWGALQIWGDAGAASGNALLYFDGTFGSHTVYYAASSGALLPLPGNATYDNPPGFLSVGGSGLQFWLIPAAYGSDVCYAQTLFGCVGNAGACRFGNTDAGAYYCTGVAPPDNYAADICMSVFTSSQVGCRDVAGMAVNQCTGWNSESFGATCREWCADSSANGKVCDDGMQKLCETSSQLPDCSCIKVATSNFPVALRDGMTYPQYACGLNDALARQVSINSDDYQPQCWWPTCNLADGGYVLHALRDPKLRNASISTGGGGCSPEFTQCFNLLSDINALPANLQVSAVNANTSSGGCGGLDFTKDQANSALNCAVAPPPADATYLAPAAAGQPPWAPPPPPTVSNIDSLFVNTNNDQDDNAGFRPPSVLASPFGALDTVCYIVIGTAAGIMLLLVIALLRASYLLDQKST